MAEHPWRALYQAAILELDPEKIAARATAAEISINAHVFADYQHIDAVERTDMERALSALDALRLDGSRTRSKPPRAA
jgi:hypothetical protein